MRPGPSERYGPAMTDVYDRVNAMSVIAQVWPTEPTSGSGFAAEAALTEAVSTFDISRHQLMTSVRRLRNAAELSRNDDGWGAHILMLRPALVLAAKAAWILRPDSPEERIGRALGLIMSDQRNGARAMRAVVKQGGLPEFGGVADKYDRSVTRLVSQIPTSGIKPPSDESMIRELGCDINRDDGGNDAPSSMQLLWNASSSLAHGENWFRMLSNGGRGAELAEVITVRSLDIVCSGISVTSSRILGLSSMPAEKMSRS